MGLVVCLLLCVEPEENENIASLLGMEITAKVLALCHQNVRK